MVAPKKPTKKPAKKAPGRPKKAPEEKLEQFSIRLPPKLKFGLELLARAQNRSLSQAVEWAVQVGMNSFDVDRDGTSLGEVVERAWAEPNEAARILRIYGWVPTLLPFEDMVTCDMLWKSIDISEISRHDGGEEDSKAAQAAEAAYWAVAQKNWAALRNHAVRLANSGRPVQGELVALMLGILGTPEGRPLRSVYLDAARVLT